MVCVHARVASSIPEMYVPYLSVVLPPFALGGQYYSRAHFRVRSRTVVIQGHADPLADVWEPCRIDVPLRSRKLYRTDEGQRRQFDPASSATGKEHAPVESRVVGGDKLGAVKPGPQGRPEFSQSRCATHVFPCEAMASGKRKSGDCGRMR